MSAGVKFAPLRGSIRRIKSFLSGLDSASSWRLLVALLMLRVYPIRGVRLEPTRHSDSPSSEASRTPRMVPLVPTDGNDIPQIIFQTWKARASLPDNYAYWSQSFRDQNPGYQYLLWDDADNRDFMAQDFPWFLRFYDSYPAEIFRADIVRFFFLFRFGGFYSDLDTQCLHPLDEVLAGKHVVLGRMSWTEEFTQAIPNAMMASRPGELFWLLAVAIAIERHADLGARSSQVAVLPEDFTGPGIVRAAVAAWQSTDESAVRSRAATVLEWVQERYAVRSGELTVLDCDEWYPIDWSNPVHAEFRETLLRHRFLPTNRQLKMLFPRSSLVTFWTHSW